MAALRRSGGAGRRFKFVWQGATVFQQIDAAIAQALEDEAKEIRLDLLASLHKITGRMAAESFAEVSVAGTKRQLALGSDAPYSVYEELGTSRRPGHHVIRSVADRHAGHITQRLKAARGGR